MSETVTDTLLALQRDYKTVFGTPEGQRVLDHILTRLCGMNVIISPAATPTAVAMATGARNVGVAILETMEKPVREIPELRRRRPS
jgi:hypothetical protein